MAAPSLNTGEALPISKQTNEDIDGYFFQHQCMEASQPPKKSIERTDAIFVICACNIDRMAILVLSSLYGRVRNLVTTVDENPGRGSTRSVVTELFGARIRVLVPVLHTPRKGLFLRHEGRKKKGASNF